MRAAAAACALLNPLLPRRHTEPPLCVADVVCAKVTILPVTSDKGLCGGINSTVVKYTRIVDKVNTEMPGAIPVGR